MKIIVDALYFTLKYILLFSVGTVAGWLIELFWRRYFGEAKRWINPGFLQGPWLPLYGFGTIILYRISSLNLPLYLLALTFLISLTLLEYIAGLIFIHHFKIKLWDYSRNKGNIQGLICPLYSLLWTILGLFFFLMIYPRLNSIIDQLYNYLQLSFFIGLFTGLFTVDLWQSFNIAGRIKKFVDETEEKIPVDFENLKLELRDRVREGFRNHTRFFFPFRGELGTSFLESLRSHTLNIQFRLKPFTKVLNKRLNRDNKEN